jgi:hypothetical protein
MAGLRGTFRADLRVRAGLAFGRLAAGWPSYGITAEKISAVAEARSAKNPLWIDTRTMQALLFLPSPRHASRAGSNRVGARLSAGPSVPPAPKGTPRCESCASCRPGSGAALPRSSLSRRPACRLPEPRPPTGVGREASAELGPRVGDADKADRL